MCSGLLGSLLAVEVRKLVNERLFILRTTGVAAEIIRILKDGPNPPHTSDAANPPDRYGMLDGMLEGSVGKSPTW